MKYYKKSKGSKYSARQRSPYRYRLPYGTDGVYGGQDNAYKYYRHHAPIKPEKVSYEKLLKYEHQPERVIKVESSPQIKFPEYRPETTDEKIRHIVKETFEKMKLEEQIERQTETPLQKDERIEKLIEEPLQTESVFEQMPDLLDLTMPDLLSLESELDPMNPLEIQLDLQKKDAERGRLEAEEYDY
jgi:hypothetical protein